MSLLSRDGDAIRATYLRHGEAFAAMTPGRGSGRADECPFLKIGSSCSMKGASAPSGNLQTSRLYAALQVDGVFADIGGFVL